MTEKESAAVDMAAVARVSRRVNLTEVVLTQLGAHRQPGQHHGSLDVTLKHAHRVLSWDETRIQVESQYVFVGTQGNTDVVDAMATYQLAYAVETGAPLAEGDVMAFGPANGAYHSWPFVRELLFGLTSKLGFPPFTLPVLTFAPPKPPDVPEQPTE